MRRGILLILALIICSTLTAVAQVSTCVLTGHVCDTEGKPVVSAMVRIMGTTLGEFSKTPDGRFTVQNIPTGECEVRITAIGYAPAVYEIRFVERQSTVMGVQFIRRDPLRGGPMCIEPLMVTGEFLMVNPERFGTTSTITADELDRMP